MNMPSISHQLVSFEDYYQLNLEGELTIYTALEAKTLILNAINHLDLKRLIVNLESVIEIDSSGLQILVFAKKYAKTFDIELKLSTLSNEVNELLTLYHLENYF